MTGEKIAGQRVPLSAAPQKRGRGRPKAYAQKRADESKGAISKRTVNRQIEADSIRRWLGVSWKELSKTSLKSDAQVRALGKLPKEVAMDLVRRALGGEQVSATVVIAELLPPVVSDEAVKRQVDRLKRRYDGLSFVARYVFYKMLSAEWAERSNSPP